jgi:large subunit ribosomal protein MRP49
MLPRIKYRNPIVPIEVKRHNSPTGPALLHIYTSTSSKPTAPASDISVSDTASTPPSSTPNARDTLVPTTATPAHTVDIKDTNELEILAQLVSRTGATEIKATEEEEAEMNEIKEFNVRREKDRVEVREKLVKERREEELLRLARGEVTGAA